MKGSFCLLAIGCALTQPAAARAATFTVDSTVDAPDANPGDGLCQTAAIECTLRAAIMETNALGGADVVTLPAGTYALTIPPSNPFEEDSSVGDLDVTDHLSLRGAGAGTTLVDAGGLGDRVLDFLGDRFRPDPLQSEIVGLTLSGGTTPLTGGCLHHRGNGTLAIRNSVISACKAEQSVGGGIYHDGTGQVGRVVLIDSMVRDNRASFGGGIGSDSGELELVRSVVTRNSAVGPAMFSAQLGGGILQSVGILTAIDSVISDNVAGRKGGGIYSGLARGQLSLIRTTVNGNEALNAIGDSRFGEGSGGGLYVERVPLRIANSTISGNRAAVEGGGIYGERQASFQITFSTIANNRNLSNSGAAGLEMRGAQPFLPYYQTLMATVLAGNASDGGTVGCRFTETVFVSGGGSFDRPMPPVSRGFNLDEDGSCGLTATGDLSSVPAGLGPLAPNGGVGDTHALLAGSPALDHVPTAQCSFGIDDDFDFRIDEDPVNGLDDDGDFRVDEDPVEAVLTDQRGAARPRGSGCDTGSFEGDGPAERLAELRVLVQALITSGTVNHGQGNALLTKLAAAQAALAAGDTAAAISHLEAFVNQVEAFERAGILTAEEAGPVLAAAQALIAQLGG